MTMTALKPRIHALRGVMAQQAVQAFIIPHADEFQNEYLPPSAEHLAHFTGFTGSAGAAIVLADKAALLVDGRYTLQAPAETDSQIFTILNSGEVSLLDYALSHLKQGDAIGFDPWLHTAEWYDMAVKKCAQAEVRLTPLQPSPIATLWAERPAPPAAPFEVHAEAFAGEGSLPKRQRIAALLRESAVDAFIITAPDAVAWLLNMRGQDVPHTPLPLAFAVLHQSGMVDLYAAQSRFSPALLAHLGGEVQIKEPEAFLADISAAAASRILAADFSQTAQAIIAAGQGKIKAWLNPMTLAKACKNKVEIAGSRTAHLRDGVAMVRALAWIDAQAPQGTLDELTVMAQLKALRAEGALFRDLSFETIAGSGAHGAIVHYKSTPKTNRCLQQGELFLLDSGAQYQDGTTDITRTMIVGTPTPAMKTHYTLVLKGHIALSCAVFPQGVTGHQLDALARQFLWQAGLDYDHGTGHGVGSYLSVHEGPQRISARATVHNVLYEGMILSNEPGYYKAGAYGIRIENLVAVEKRDVDGAEKNMLGFEVLTLCPYDRRLMDRALLTADEIAWINAYHQRVWQQLSPNLAPDVRAWLEAACATIVST